MGQAEAEDLGLDGGPLYDPLRQLPLSGAGPTGTTGRGTRDRPRRAGRPLRQPGDRPGANPKSAAPSRRGVVRPTTPPRAIGLRPCSRRPARPSMEDILASIKRVIAEEKGRARRRLAARARRGGRSSSRPWRPSSRGRAPSSTTWPAAARRAEPPTQPPALEQLPPSRERRRRPHGQSARGHGPRDAEADAQAMARRASAGDRRRACEARDRPHHRPPALVLAFNQLRGRFASASRP